MSDDKKYNGWTNYETWAVNLWMSNDEGSYRYWEETAQEVWADAEAGTYDWQTREFQADYALAERLKDEHEENVPVAEASVYTDLLQAALDSVNWQEIAEHLLADVDKTEAIEAEEVES